MSGDTSATTPTGKTDGDGGGSNEPPPTKLSSPPAAKARTTTTTTPTTTTTTIGAPATQQSTADPPALTPVPIAATSERGHVVGMHGGIPLPPSDAFSHEKSPGFTRGSLLMSEMDDKSNHHNQSNRTTTTTTTTMQKDGEQQQQQRQQQNGPDVFLSLATPTSSNSVDAGQGEEEKQQQHHFHHPHVHLPNPLPHPHHDPDHSHLQGLQNLLHRPQPLHPLPSSSDGQGPKGASQSVPSSPIPDLGGGGVGGGFANLFRKRSVGAGGGGKDHHHHKEKEKGKQAGGAGGVGGGGGGEDQVISRAPSRASSVKSARSVGGGGSGVGDDDAKYKFTLKDLLANGSNKLNRRASQKSAGGSSRKSDSDYEHDGPEIHSASKPSRAPRSQAGESVGSLNQKYGVCAKVAIGKGATSVVRLAHKWDRAEEKLYAVKEFRKRRKNESEKEYVKKLTAEFCISSTLHHTNIVETVDLVQDENQKWCEVMEFCPGGDLYAAIKKGGMSPAEAECCFKQICSGVAYLHSQGVAHRDLKPENLFFDTKGRLKIGDYGASTVYRLPWEKTVHMSTGLCGSEPYIAPEQFLHRPYDARLVDIWAVAIIYYCLHFQELPWRAAQQSDEMYHEYYAACLQFPLPASREVAEAAMNTGKDGREKHGSHGSAVPGCPSTINNLSPRACRPLIRHMLEPDPKKRATIEDVMQYSWYKSISVCFEQDPPGHIHANAQSMANSVLKEAWD